MNTLNFQERLQEYDTQIAGLREARAKLIDETQRSCPHDLIYEAPYRTYEVLGGYEPDFRVCAHCGYAEQGWGTGYWGLRNSSNPIGQLSREQAYKLVLKFYKQPDFPEWAVAKAHRELKSNEDVH